MTEAEAGGRVPGRVPNAGQRLVTAEISKFCERVERTGPLWETGRGSRDGASDTSRVGRVQR